MAKFNLNDVWTDVKAYRRAYILTAVASFGGMLFGWDTGLIGTCIPTTVPTASNSCTQQVVCSPWMLFNTRSI